MTTHEMMTHEMRDQFGAQLKGAFGSVRYARSRLLSLFDEVEAGETARAKELAKAMGDLVKAVETVLKEGDRIDAWTAGESGGAELDLDAARAEVGRRLARLRRARDPGRLPGEPR